MLEAIAQEISSKVGLLCLTEEKDSLPMWAYYGGNAAGLAVEFRDLAEAFRGDDTGLLSEPAPVRYERDNFGITFDPQSHRSLFFSKFRDWGHEREVRVVMPLAECRKVSNGKRQLHVFDIPPRHISRVILGWQMTSDTVDTVVDWVQSINPAVQIVRARVERGKSGPMKSLFVRTANPAQSNLLSF